MKDINRRLKKAERQLGVGYDIERTVLILGAPEQEGEIKAEMSKAEKAEYRAGIDLMIQNAIKSKPKNRFIFLIAG